jgi:hypothetical protein
MMDSERCDVKNCETQISILGSVDCFEYVCGEANVRVKGFMCDLHICPRLRRVCNAEAALGAIERAR